MDDENHSTLDQISRSPAEIVTLDIPRWVDAMRQVLAAWDAHQLPSPTIKTRRYWGCRHRKVNEWKCLAHGLMIEMKSFSFHRKSIVPSTYTNMGSRNESRKNERAPNNSLHGLRGRARPSPVSFCVSAPSEAWRFQQGEGPCQGRVNHPPVPSVAVMEEVLYGLNETIEAYTGNHVDRRGDRTSQSLIQPR